MVISLRKNASRKSILEAMKQLQEAWDRDAQNPPVIDGEYGVRAWPEPYLLKIGGVVRWGYAGGFSAWGFDKSHVLREISAQQEYVYRQILSKEP